jgi:hypothetical protein
VSSAVLVAFIALDLDLDLDLDLELVVVMDLDVVVDLDVDLDTDLDADLDVDLDSELDLDLDLDLVLLAFRKGPNNLSMTTVLLKAESTAIISSTSSVATSPRPGRAALSAASSSA